MSNLKEQKWMMIVYSFILFAIGVVQFILTIVDFSSAMAILSYAFAVGLFIIGLMLIVTSFIFNTKSFFDELLILGAISIACGIVFIVLPYILGSFISYLISSLFLTLGLVSLVKAIIGIKFKYKSSWIFIYFFTAVIGITLGILAFIFIKKSLVISQIIYCLLGGVIAVAGIVLFVYTMKQVKQNRNVICDGK